MFTKAIFKDAAHYTVWSGRLPGANGPPAASDFLQTWDGSSTNAEPEAAIGLGG